MVMAKMKVTVCESDSLIMNIQNSTDPIKPFFHAAPRPPTMAPKKNET